MMKTEPFDYQKPVLKKILSLKQFALFSEYGTGKSYIILYWLWHHRKKFQNNILIVAENRNIHEEKTWPIQIQKHTNFLYFIISGTAKVKKDAFKNNILFKNHIYICSYQTLLSFHKEIIQRKFDVVVFDESTALKNYTTRTTKRAMKIAEKTPYRIVATGFPVTERYMELWTQMYIVDLGKRLTDNYYKFLNKYFYRWMFGWKIKKGKTKIISDKIKDISVFLKLRECVDLPPRMYKYISLEPTKEQQKMIQELKDDFVLSLQEPDRKIEYKYILPVLEKIQQIASGFVYENNNKTYFLKQSSPKDKKLKELVEEISNKKIIWCKYKEDVLSLSALLSNHDPLYLSSKDTEKKRSQVLKEFRESNKHILITTYDLLASGETITECNYNIHYSHIWSNEKTTNAQARTYRVGSERHRKVVYIYLYIEGLEYDILKRIKKKKKYRRELEKYMKGWINE